MILSFQAYLPTVTKNHTVTYIALYPDKTSQYPVELPFLSLFVINILFLEYHYPS